VRRAIALLLLLGLVLAGCAGEDSTTDGDQRQAVGEPTAATNDDEARDDVRGDSGRPGIKRGPPSLEDLRGLPPRVGVGGDGSSCAGTQLVPSTSNLAGVKGAILCLLNAERKARGLKPLRANGRLARAAALHSHDMVAKRYFSHTSLTGEDFVVRIKRVGYIRPGKAWTLGENLAWGTGSLAAPVGIVRGWMESPGHKANILNGRFQEVGIGIALGVPLPDVGGSGATFNTGFGAVSD